MQSEWPWGSRHLTRKPDFSQTCSFNRIIKFIMEHDLNPNNLHISGHFFFVKPKKNHSGGVLGHYPRNKLFSQKSGSASLASEKSTLLASEKSFEPFWRKRVYLLTYWHTGSGDMQKCNEFLHVSFLEKKQWPCFWHWVRYIFQKVDFW